MVQYSTEIIDLLIAPDLSKFTVCHAPDITASHPEARHWLANHFLNTLFGPRYKDKYRQWALNQLYRAEVAFRDYHEARALTSETLLNGSPSRPALRSYFKAVARWESCLLNVQIFIDLANRMKKELGDDSVFKEGDGSRDQRAYSLANTIKHWGSDVASGRHEEHQTIPVWLTNDGLRSWSTFLTFIEVASLVDEIASVADALQDPKSFASAGDA